MVSNKFVVIFIAAYLLNSYVCLPHPCQEIYHKALNSISQNQIATLTIPLWGSFAGASAIASGGSAIILSPLFLLSGTKRFLSLGAAGVTLLAGGILYILQTATFPVSGPIFLASYQRVKNNLKKSQALLEEIDHDLLGPYTKELAQAAGMENRIEQFFCELKRADFCPCITKKANIKELNGHGVFDFKSLKKIVAFEHRGDFSVSRYGSLLRFKTKYSGISSRYRYGFGIGGKKIAQL
jgi:hypothetical protein